MSPDNVEYAQRVSIVALGGAVLGTLIGQAASKPPTIGKSLLGTIIGATIAGSGYGIYLRTGGTAPGKALTGVRRFRRGPGAASRVGLRQLPGVYPGRFRRLGETTALLPGRCYQA